MKNIIIVIGPGQIGQAIARRVGVGKHVLLADQRRENAEAAAQVMANAGYIAVLVREQKNDAAVSLIARLSSRAC